MKKIIVALDGTSSTGKSSIAKILAAAVGYTYIDTGAMYRAVTLLALRNGLFDKDGTISLTALKEQLDKCSVSFRLNPATGHSDTFLNGENVERKIRDMEVSGHVSPIAAVPFVREALVAQQRRMGEAKGVVMDGRDIGTVVFPQAEMKVFMTASPEIRAERRFKELKEKGMPADYNDVLKNVRERDYIDSHRAVAPLRPAADAIVLDNSHMTMDEEKVFLLNLFKEKTES